jgi:maleate cis-trans isomerase
MFANAYDNLPYGWRARVAFIRPPTNSIAIYEFARIAPVGVHAVETRLSLENFTELTEERVMKMVGQIESAIKTILITKPDIIATTGTPYMFVAGRNYELILEKRVKEFTEVPVLHAASSVAKSLKKLNVKRPALVHYYPSDLREKWGIYLKTWGIDAIANQRLPIWKDRQPGYEDYPLFDEHGAEFERIPYDITFRFAKHICRSTPECDGLVISGIGMRTLDIIEPLEEDLGIPVTSSGVSLYWDILQTAGVGHRIVGYGSLLSSLGRSHK